MKRIRIKKRVSDNFGDPIAELFRLMEEIYRVPSDEEISIDMRDCSFLTPPFLLAVVLIVKKSLHGRIIHIDDKFNN